MYRYGDGSPFPLDENFIETLTAAVTASTNAFLLVTELDGRRERAKEARRDADGESIRLAEVESAVTEALVPFVQSHDKTSQAHQVAQRLATSTRQAVAEARRQIDQRAQSVETQASPQTIAEAITKALRTFFDEHQLPKTQWIMSWDVRGAEPHANAVATSGALSATFRLSPDPYRVPIRVEQLAEGVVVRMMRKGVFGKAKPAPVDLAKYVMVAFEKTVDGALVVTLRESASKTAPGVRFAVDDEGGTWVAISPSGDAEGEQTDLDHEDVAAVRSLASRAQSALKDLLQRRNLEDVFLDGKSVDQLSEPRRVPLELLSQLQPLARSLRDKSRVSGELVLKRDVGDGRREELFVPRATLAQQFTRLPYEYRRPFEEMGITAEETQPAIQLPIRPPAKTASEADETIEYDLEQDE